MQSTSENGFPESPVAVVTGGGSGIGEAVCHQLNGLGVAVAVLDVDFQAAKQVAKELDDMAAPAIAIEADVTNLTAVRAAVDKAGTDLGTPVNLVVHSAGWTGPNAPYAELSVGDQERIIDVNFTGALHMVRSTLPGMLDAGGGAYVLISSDAARVGTPKEAVYAGAKAAMIAFAKSVSVEVADKGIRVNVVSPGSTDTRLLREALQQVQIDKRINANPMRRLGSADEVASAVTFLLANTASYITGQVLSVNGGMSRVD